MLASGFSAGGLTASPSTVNRDNVYAQVNAVPGQKAHGQGRTLMSTGSIPSVDCTVQVHDEDPFTIVLYSFHRPRGSSETGHT